MGKAIFVREKLKSSDGWQCYRRKYGSIHSFLVPKGTKWEWRHCDGYWVEVNDFDSVEDADAFIKERYNVRLEIM